MTTMRIYLYSPAPIGEDTALKMAAWGISEKYASHAGGGAYASERGYTEDFWINRKNLVAVVTEAMQAGLDIDVDGGDHADDSAYA
jgi:hypothetical protein